MLFTQTTQLYYKRQENVGSILIKHEWKLKSNKSILLLFHFAIVDENRLVTNLKMYMEGFIGSNQPRKIRQ